MIETKTFVDQELWEGKGMIGQWTKTSGGTVNVVDITTDEVIAAVGIGTAEDVKIAAAKAAKAQVAWAARPAQERAYILNKAADLIDQNLEELVELLMRDTGSIRPKAEMEVAYCAGYVRDAAKYATMPMEQELPSYDEGRKNVIRRIPHGVIGVISPFNFPMLLAIRVIAPALAMGNAVVNKPDPRTAISGGILISRVFEEAGLPANVLQNFAGGAEAGEALCSDPNIQMISFTGSPAIGSKVGEIAGRHIKKVQLELGGKNPVIILDDADLDVAASNIAWGAFLHQGQICMSTGLVLIDEKIADSLAEKVAERAKNLPTGDPKAGLPLGPMIGLAQAEKTKAIVDDAVNKGAKLLAGGNHDGKFFEATVLLGVKPGMRAFEEEIFGPVACLTTYTTEQEAIDLANSSEYGLTAGVIGKDIARAEKVGKQLVVGQLHINDQTVNVGWGIPFGGVKKSGNGTRISGISILDEYTQWSWISTKEEATAYPF